MRRLPLYGPELLESALNHEEPLERDPACVRCEMHDGVHTVCMPADDARPGDSGGVLLVSEYPGGEEDRAGRPMMGVSGRMLRALLARWGFADKVVITNALGCAPGRRKVTSKHVRECRPFVANVARLAQPERVVCLGGTALESVLGRRPAVLSVRKGYSWHRTDAGPVPVFFTVNPAAAGRNRFVREAFEEDLKWALTCERPPCESDAVTFLVETADDADCVRAAIEAGGAWTAYDVETHGQMHDPDFRIECVSFAPEGRPDVFTFTREAMRDAEVRVVLRQIVERIDAVTANGKYDDRSVLLDLGAVARESYADVRLMSRMLDPAAAAKLEVISERVGLGGHKKRMKEHTDAVVRELNAQAKPKPALTPSGKARKPHVPKFEVPPEVLAKIAGGADPRSFMYGYTDADLTYLYNAADAHTTRTYAKRVIPEFRSHPEVSRVWDLVVRDANRAVRWIEHWGIGVDRQAVDQFATYCKAKVAEARAGIGKYGDVNPNAPAQVADLLFNRLGLRRVKQTDGGADSTDSDVLEALAGKHPVVDHLAQFRKYDKLDGTYATGMVPHIRSDGRIHCSYLLDGAGTGRLSCADPNMQNIPRAKGDPDAKMARNCFVARRGHVILETDYAQLELRVAALLSGDEVMIDDFKRGIDLHMNMTNELYGLVWGFSPAEWERIPPTGSGDVKGKDYYRSIVKNAFVFGGFYGKTNKTLSRELGCSTRDVEVIFGRIWGRYPKLAAWRERMKAQGQREGGVWTYWGGQRARWRPLWGVADPDEGVRINAINSTINTPCQGTGADYMTASLWPVCSWIIEDAFPARVVYTVHDSLGLEVDRRFVAEAAGKVKEVMQSHWSGEVPLDVDQVYGEAWGSLTEKIKG